MNYDIEMSGRIQNREAFTAFMKHFTEEIEDTAVREYLKSVTAWAEDMDGYYQNNGINPPENINWDFIATLLYAGSIYE